MRQRAWPFLVLAAVLFAAPAAEAAKSPPRTELRANGDSARISPFTYGWTFPSGGGCANLSSDGIPTYDPEITVAQNHARPRIAFRGDRRPRVRRFRAHAELDDGNMLAGRGKRVRFKLQPKRSRGEVTAWTIAFRVNVAKRPYFDLGVRFPPRGECDEGGSAYYAFGIERE